MDSVEALRLVAMRAVMRGDGEYNLRYILRWYSRTFFTPLPVVEDLPVEDVLQAYFETVYEEMPEDRRMEEIHRLLQTEEERERAKLAEDAADAEAAEFARLSELKALPKRKKKGSAIQQAADAIDGAAANLKKVAQEMSEPIKAVEPVPEPQPVPKVLPDIKMTFIESDSEFESMLEGSWGPPEKKPG